MVTLVVILFGLVSASKLPVELNPNTSFGQISIIIEVRGGIPPTEVEQLVTKPVEEAVATVSNLQELFSISKEGESTVVLNFNPGTDMDFAALEVREKFAKIKNKLPKDIEKPIIAQFQQGDVPILVVSAVSQVRSTEDIRKIVDNTMKEALKRVSGVANVEVVGGRERKILVEFDQVKLASFGIPADEVTNVLSGNNLNLLSGEVERTRDKFLVRVIGEFETIEQIKNMAIRRVPNGSVIRVKDVASVKDSFLEPQSYARLNVQPVVTIYVQKESSKNTIQVSRDILAQINQLKTRLPKDISLVITTNQAETIERNIEKLKESLLAGIVLIFLVLPIFLFRMSRELLFIVGALALSTAFLLKGALIYLLFLAVVMTVALVPKLRSVMIVTLSIPVSVIGTFIFMQRYGLTINIMTLFGLALGVGMLVDNSIVVFDNILKKRDLGQGMLDSSIHGTQEMLLAIVASTIATVIVFLPMVFMGKELKLLYSGIAWTIVVSLLISLLAALTLVPMMCSRPELTAAVSAGESIREGSWLQKFTKIERKFLFRSIRYRKRVFIVCVGVTVFALLLASRLGREYLGSTEQNKFTIFIEMPTGARLDASDKVVKKVENLVRTVPEVKNVTSRVEGWSCKVYVELVSSTQRKRSTTQVIDALRPQTDRLRPAFIYYQQEEQIGTKEVILNIYGYQYDKLRELAIAVSNRMESIRGLTDVKIRMREGRPEMHVLVNKKRAGLYDLTSTDLANQIHGQMRGFRATVYHTEGKEVETISRLDEKYRKTFKDLHHLIITNRTFGDPVYLKQATDFEFGLGPDEIWRKDKNRFVQVSANIGKVPLTKVVDALKKNLRSVPFPEDYTYEVAGDYPLLVRSNKELNTMIVIVLILVYLVLASLFESYYQPLLIMVAVPLALVGAVAALYLGPRSIGIGAMLGMMMLSGIVVNHSIMLVDRINYYVKLKGLSSIRAAILANRDRLRPILMTMSTTVLGLIPMAIDRSEGANLWSPLALTVIGGVVSSTILTLMVTPAFYIISRDILVNLKKYHVRGIFPGKALNKASA